MPDSITIPASIDAAVEALNGLGQLITARKWERSAIVAAFVRLSPGRGQSPQHSRLPNGESTISVEDFAALDIYGLTQPQAVRKYVQAWLDEHDGKYPRAGATRRLPTSGFPPMRTGTNGHSTEDGAATTIGRIFDQHEPEEVIDQLPDETVGRIVTAATRRRRRVTQQAVANTLAEELPEPPFPEPPSAYPGAETDGLRMDVRRDEAHLGDAIGRIERWRRERPELLDVNRLEAERDRLALVCMDLREAEVRS